jgi:hypothetical protein
MTLVSFWKFLHIACMFGAVALLVGGGIINNQVQKGRGRTSYTRGDHCRGPRHELQAVLAGGSRTRVVNFVDAVFWIGLIFTMVVKPGGF